MNRGRGNRGGNSRGRAPFQQGPPETIVAIGSYLHPCEAEMVCKSNSDKIPYFNAPIYLENKTQIGKVDEIFGPINEMYFSVKLSEGMISSSFSTDLKVFIATDKLLPLSRFLPKPTLAIQKRPKKSNQPAVGRSNFSIRGRGTRGRFQTRGGRGMRGNMGRGAQRGFKS